MARAAAKRRQPTHHHRDDRRHKDSGGQRFEDTLFFSKLRKRTKWVFILLALIFGITFVVFGVGSSVGGAGLSDIFNGIRGGGSGEPSVSKAEKATQRNPKDAAAWKTLATAYDSNGDIVSAISAWATYTTLRPKDTDGLQALATDYEQQFSNQTQEAAAAQAEAQNTQATQFGPPPTSPLGRALNSVSDPITQAASQSANQRFNTALQTRQATAQQLGRLQEARGTAQAGRAVRPAAARPGGPERRRHRRRDRRIQDIRQARARRSERGLRAPADQGARLALPGLDSRGAEIPRRYAKARGDEE